METITRQQKQDIRLLARFIDIHCAGRHATAGRHEVPLPAGLGTVRLCRECGYLMGYAAKKRLACPLEGNKPSCRRCRIHCYGEREQRSIRQVMAYAGKRMIMRGRVDYLWHVLF